MPDSSGSIDLGNLSTEEQEAVEKIARETGTSPDEPNGAKDVLEVDTAFVVIIKDGEVGVVPPGTNLDIGHQPHPDEIYGAVSTIRKDLEAVETAQATIQAQVERAQIMQQQIQNQHLQAQLQKGGLKV